MLFVSLTRSSILEHLPRQLSREFSVGPPWTLTYVTDNFLSRLDVSENEIVGSESLLAHVDNRDQDVEFVAARFVRSESVLQVSKRPVSGRSVYYCVGANGEFYLSTHIYLLRQAGVPIE